MHAFLHSITARRHDNVEAGYGELQKLYASVMSNRSFILKLFGVLLFVVAVFAVFRTR